MFKNKINVPFTPKKGVSRTINGVKILVSQWLPDDVVAEIVGTCSEYYVDLFENDELATATVSTMAQMEILVAKYATNVDMADMSYEEFTSSGLVNIVHSDIFSYKTILSALTIAINTINTSRIVHAMSSIAGKEELGQTEEKVRGLLEAFPVQAKQMLDTTLSNNPALAKFLQGVAAETNE